jgi:hypothetical protein
MAARCKRETGTLTVTFAATVSRLNGRQALQHAAVRLLLTHRKLRAGDKLTVEAAD